MAAKPWKCLNPQCRTINDPNEEFRETDANTCTNCNQWRFLLPTIGAGSLAVLAALIIGIVWLTGMPERTYRAKYTEFLHNDNRIDEAEEAELSKLAAKHHLSDEVVTRIRNGERVVTAAPSPSSSPETVVKPEASVTREEVIAVLHNIYSDKLKTTMEQQYLAEMLTRANINQSEGEQLEQQVKTDWERARPSFESGLNLTKHASYEAAIVELKRAGEADQKNAWILTNLGAAYSESNHLDESLKSYQQALEVDNKNWLAHYNLGSLRLREGNREQAIQELSNALRFAAEDPTQHITKADILEQMRADKSLKSLRDDSRFMQLIAPK